MVEKDDLIKKLENVPEEVLRSILTNQVDLEIRLKHKELKLTEEEIGKCEAQMLALRKFFEVPNEVSFRSEPNDFTLKYFDILNKSLSVNYTKLQQKQYALENPVFNEAMFTESEPTTHTYRTRSTTSSLRPSIGGPAVRIAGCLYRRTDGVVVKLTCTGCQRSNFSSAQGFLNHNRIAHSREYASQDSAALECGEVLPDEFQDEEGLASLVSLRQLDVNPAKNLKTREGYFDGLNTPTNKTGALSYSNSYPEHSSKPATRKSTPESSKEPKAQAKVAKDVLRDSLMEGVGTQELMKKLISSGLARDAKDFQSLIGEVQKEVSNSHLFADEEEVVEEVEGQDKREEKNSLQETNGPEKPKRGASETQRPKIQKNNDPLLQAGDSTVKPETTDTSVLVRAEIGGKYENRLRRRKSRAEMSLAGTETEDEPRAKGSEDRRHKRKKSHR
ncbi:hypothetical protein METBIDRAFT_45871 [Metschnikowia bicuspidata var. bicuspidata NRRL YB-4993]|uniref:AHC1-like C2H2 zinc-finger domain-containing protein n=1 Tax=Metschnikowia bicuspidata var. bicuspidata NRRL YB-4993 TaxID=869754 RepID=A0A1A0H674_9ASCO|nr:hypothetical protein METBIDRAFT_45871 [Metschnikowia bicuspidata var. bicuspidata NRRL YB-4993]OBA19460.1 hypothetical protein METBIDRAFT_45871 [Metschnikowia bicuspidata var. bicuspidata NRRL YB-4993]